MERYILFLFILVIYSCSDDKKEWDGDSNTSVISEKSDTLINQYAESFRIIQHSETTEIQIINLENNSVQFNYFFGETQNNANILKLNPERVVALSATHIGMLEELELLDRIVGISNDKYLCSSQLKKQVEEGAVKSVGNIGMADIEGYVAVDPDLVIYSGFDTEAPILKKLHSAGIKTFTNYDWKETHPLGRAEWLKVFGVIFDKQEEAEKLFNTIKTEYVSLAEEVREFSSKKSVLVGTMYGDIFNAPAGDSYMAKLLEDANLNYKYRETKGTGSLSLTLEKVISDNRDTDIWLNVAAQSKDKVLEMNNRFRLLESIDNNLVYSYFHEVNCFWEKSVIHPHLLLQDICKIAYPEQFEIKTFTFYRNLK